MRFRFGTDIGLKLAKVVEAVMGTAQSGRTGELPQDPHPGNAQAFYRGNQASET